MSTTKVTLRRYRSPFKHCPTCKRNLPRTAYHKDQRRKDGLRSQCKDCIRTRNERPEVKQKHQQAQQKYRQRLAG